LTLARYFAAGFFGLDWQNSATLEVISEGPELGADTLTPDDTCPRSIDDEEESWARGRKGMHKYRATYFPNIRKRLSYQTKFPG
jgi:acid phosphatase